MSLSLEQVRQTRFHLTRRTGYKPLDVDNFVDQVEVTLAQLVDENETLKQQVDALTSDGTGEDGSGASSTEGSDERVAAMTEELSRVRAELDERTRAWESARAESESARAALAEGDAGEALSRLQADLDRARADLVQRDQRISEIEGLLEGATSELEDARAAQDETSKIEHIVVTASTDAAPAVTKLLQMATEQAERLVDEAQTEADTITSSANEQAATTIEDAATRAHEALTSARARADELQTKAQTEADTLTGQARDRVEALGAEVDQRRSELFSELEGQRDELRGKVEHLRSFEERYRHSLSAQLQGHLDALAGKGEPDDVPALLTEPDEPSATPRLDALLDESN